MRKVLTYEYRVFLEDAFGHGLDSFKGSKDIVIDESFDDVFEFMFANAYHRKHDPMDWFLEKGAMSMYKDLERRWLKNELDLHVLYFNDPWFEDFLLRKHASQAQGEIEAKVIDDVRELYPDIDVIPYVIDIDGDCMSVSGEVYNGR